MIKDKFNGKCYNCNHHGHRANECKEKPKFEGKCHKCNKHGHNSSECKIKILNLAEQIVKATFGWDYNTQCKYHYYGEFGYIGMNCVKHHMRKIDNTKRCFICTKLGHLVKNYMNTRRIEDEKKENFDNIRKQMRHQGMCMIMVNQTMLLSGNKKLERRRDSNGLQNLLINKV